MSHAISVQYMHLSSFLPILLLSTILIHLLSDIDLDTDTPSYSSHALARTQAWVSKTTLPPMKEYG
jgi:hypothetical protein